MQVNFMTGRKAINVQQDLASHHSLALTANENDREDQFSVGHLAGQVDIIYFEGYNTIFHSNY